MAATTSPAITQPALAPLPALIDPEPCVNCGAAIHGRYCSDCGERRASDRDNTVWGFAKEALQTITNADRSFVGALRQLITRPGYLTAEYMRGRRSGFVRPLQLFLLVNVMYFLWATAMHSRVFDTNLPNHMTRTWHGPMATRMVHARLGYGSVSREEYARRFVAYRARFDEMATVQAKTLIGAMIPAFALLVWLVHIRRRRYAVEHMVFALHTYAAFIVLFPLTALLLAIPMFIGQSLSGVHIVNDPMVDSLLGLTVGVVLVWYLTRALKVVYGDSKAFAFVSAVVLFVGMGLILFGYRTVLFLTTFAMT